MNNKQKEIVKADFEEVPQYIYDYLNVKKINNIITCISSDLLKVMLYKTCWLALTNESVLIIIGEANNGIWTEKELITYSLDEIKKVKCETFLSSGALVATFKKTDFVLCEYSISMQKKFGHLANMINKLKEKGSLEKSDMLFEKEENNCPKCNSRYKDIHNKVCPKCSNKKAMLIRVLSYAPKYKLSLIFIMITITINLVFGLIRPQLANKFLYDQVLATGTKYHGQILLFFFLVLTLELLILITNIINGRTLAKVAAEMIYDLKVELFTSMQRLSMSFFNSKQTGSLMTRVNNDALDVQYFLSDGVPYFITNFVTILAIGVIIFMQSPLLGLLVFLPAPLIAFIIRKLVPKFKKLKWVAWLSSSRLNSLINDNLTGIRVVKAFGKENQEVSRFEKVNENLFIANINAGKQAATTFPLISYFMTLGGLFVWVLGGKNVVYGEMSFGTLMTFISYIGMIYGPLDFMINAFDWWTNCMNSSQRIFEIMDKTPDIVEAVNPINLSDMAGDIVLENVTFEYEPNKPVLHNINLHITKGEMIGLVGHSGAGKSTITNIITRLYDVTNGKVLIDGINIKDLSVSDLRRQIGMVLQDTFLFSGTVAENIAYARPDATKEEIVAAAKLANAHDFIMRMPDGYETTIGIRHTNLSGGEKQRLSIARAILVDPKILILDEATASVDTQTERQIQEALERLTKGRTTIAIAHRLSTLRNANRLVVVEKGKIVELGTHEELEALEGEYYKMLERQKEALKIKGLTK